MWNLAFLFGVVLFVHVYFELISMVVELHLSWKSVWKGVDDVICRSG
jgi:hypothetical protein